MLGAYIACTRQNVPQDLRHAVKSYRGSHHCCGGAKVSVQERRYQKCREQGDFDYAPTEGPLNTVFDADNFGNV